MKITADVSTEKYNWVGCLFDLTPVFIAIVAYAISAQIFGNVAGTGKTAEIQDHLIYTLSIAIGAAALGFIIALGLTLLIASTKSLRESDQRFLFFTLLPLIPLLAQLSILWFGFGISGGLVLATIIVVCAVIPILLPLIGNPSQRTSAIIDAIFVSCVCGLGLQIFREAVGSNKGIGYFATMAIAMFDIDSFFFVLLMIAIFTSVLALLRRAAQMALQRPVV
jgi:ABC-type nitrate/sulfonate/bicarbonate transport system permease component